MGLGQLGGAGSGRVPAARPGNPPADYENAHNYPADYSVVGAGAGTDATHITCAASAPSSPAAGATARGPLRSRGLTRAADNGFGEGGQGADQDGAEC